MKRFFTKKSVALFLLSIALCGFFSFGIFGVANAATAAATPACPNPLTYYNNGTTYTYQYNSTAPQNGSVGFGWVTANNFQYTDAQIFGGASATASYYANCEQQYQQQYGTPINKPGFFDLILNTGGAILGATLTGVEYILELWLIPLVSFCLTIAGNVLDIAVNYSIIGNGFTQFLPIINGVWGLARDTCNVFFIFTLLYIAIQQIIGLAGAKLKSMLITVIVAALLINFSLFLTEVVIDAGNLVGTTLLNQITSSVQTPVSTSVLNTIGTGAGNVVTNIGSAVVGANNGGVQISSTIMNGLGLISNYQGTTTSDLSTGEIIASSIKFILYFVVMFVFFFMALLIIGRFVMLLFLMAVSPLGFMGGILFFDDAASAWRKELFNQVLIAPIFAFFMLLIIRVSQIIGSVTIISTTGNSIANHVVVYFDYIFIIFLLIKAVQITKEKSGDIGKLADRAATGLTGLAFGAATGGTALALRQTAGRGANAIAQSDWLKNKGYGVDEHGNTVANKGFGALTSRLALRASVGTAKSTMDVRETGVSKEALGFLKGEGVDIAGDHAKTSAKDGFIGATKRATEAETKFAKENLGRQDLKEDQALQENNLKVGQYTYDIARSRVAMLKAQTDWNTENAKGATKDNKKLEGLRKEIDKNDKEIAEKTIAIQENAKANQRDQYGNLLRVAKNSEEQKLRDKILKQQQTLYQEGAAISVESDLYAKVMGFDKAAAANIRKTVVRADPIGDFTKALAGLPGGIPGVTPPPPTPSRGGTLGIGKPPTSTP